MKSKVYKRKVDTWDEVFVPILDADAGTNKREDHLGEEGGHAIFAHGLQSAFIVTARFSNTYCEL